MSYPPAERRPIVDVIHGHRVDDPYRWLEDEGSPATRAWSAAQDRLTAGWLEGQPARGPLRARLTDLIPSYVGPPAVAGSRRFWLALCAWRVNL